MTFSERETGIAQVATDIVAESNRIASGVNQLIMAANNLSGYPTKYGALVADIDATAAANPSSQLAVMHKAKMDALVAEFVALQARANALVAAVGDVE